jgi:hypothetical protein
MYQSFLSYRRYVYLWLAVALSATAILAYAFHHPRGPANGGTWLGYGLGTIGAVLIVWLMLLGIRKRSYRSTSGTVQGWVSAHVYLGASLLVVVTLHTGWQFGLNVHTFAYVLMLAVIASGVFGVVIYRRMPQQLSANRTSLTREQMWAQLGDLDQRCVRLAATLPAEFQEAAASSRDRARIGDGGRAVIFGIDRSKVVLPDANGARRVYSNPDQSRLLDWLSEQLARSNEGVRTRALHEWVSLAGARRSLLRRLRRDAQMHATLQLWLYLHVPLSAGLCGALIAHIVSVFIYW